MSNYKELAIRIASAEDPYTEFSKEAAQLDEVHRTALAREVNKQFFLSRIAEKTSDGDITFNVIEPEVKGTHDFEGVSDGEGISKTASLQKEPISSKRDLINDSMFIIKTASHEDTGRFRAKSSNNKLLNEFVEHAIEKAAEDKKDEEYREISSLATRVVAELNDYRGNLIDKIAGEANDASELRTIIKMAIDQGHEGIVGDIVAASTETESELMKVASVPVDYRSAKSVSSHLEQIRYASEWINIVKEAADDPSMDKEAFVGLVGSIGLGVGKALGMVGKKALGAGAWAAKKSMTRTGAVVTPTMLTTPGVFSERSDRIMRTAM
jgi:hypothetical protein